MKDSFGFIERVDVVKEIFFYYSEYNDDINDLVLGDDVEFDVQIRNVSFLLIVGREEFLIYFNYVLL